MADNVEQASVKRQRFLHRCNECGRTFTENKSLLRHVRSSAICNGTGRSSSRFQCTYDNCALSFSRDEGRRRHEREIHQRIARGTQLEAHGHPNASLQHLQSDTSGVMPSQAYNQHCDEGVAGPASDFANVESPKSDWRPMSVALIVDSGPTTDQEPGDSASERSMSSSRSSKSDVASVHTKSTFSSSIEKLRFSFQLPFDPWGRKSLIRAGAFPRPRVRKLPPCPFCHKSFEGDYSGLKSHLDQHFLELQGEHSCDICEIGFTHEADLEMHFQCAEQGHCGFSFEHTDPCVGHHLPETVSHRLSDSDRFKLHYWVKDWDLAQLQTFCVQLDQVLGHHSDCAELDDTWSIGAIFRRSFGSSNSCASRAHPLSVPDFVDYQAQLGIGPVRLKALAKLSQLLSHRQIDRRLMDSINKQDISQVLKHIRRGANVDAEVSSPYETSDWVAWNPVTAAICVQHLELLDLLIANGANLNCHRNRKESKYWAVAWAVKTGNMEILGCLLRHEVEVIGLVGSNGAPAHLMEILREYDEEKFVELVGVLIENKVVVNRIGLPLTAFVIERGWNLALMYLLQSIAYTHITLNDLLILALARSDLRAAEALIIHGVKVDRKNKEAHPGVSTAAERQDVDRKSMLEHVRNVVRKRPDKDDFLTEATKNGSSVVVKHLLERGVLSRRMQRPVHRHTLVAWAILKGDAAIMELLVDHGYDTEPIGSSSGLMEGQLQSFQLLRCIGPRQGLAKLRGSSSSEQLSSGLPSPHSELLSCLMRIGLSMYPPRHGRDQLHNWVLKTLMTHHGERGLLEFLNALSDTDSVTTFLEYTEYNLPEKTIAHFVFRHNAGQVWKYLLEHKRTSQDLGLPLAEAYSSRLSHSPGHIDVCPLFLIDHGADIEQENRFGFTILAQAVHKKDIDMVSGLLDRGANFQCKTVTGLTALGHAIVNYSEPIVDLLLHHGAVLSDLERTQLSPQGLEKLTERSLHLLLSRRQNIQRLAAPEGKIIPEYSSQNRRCSNSDNRLRAAALTGLAFRRCKTL